MPARPVMEGAKHLQSDLGQVISPEIIAGVQERNTVSFSARGPSFSAAAVSAGTPRARAGPSPTGCSSVRRS